MLTVMQKTARLVAVLVLAGVLSGCSITNFLGIGFDTDETVTQPPGSGSPPGSGPPPSSEPPPVGGEEPPAGGQPPGSTDPAPGDSVPGGSVPGSHLPGLVPATTPGRLSGFYIAIDAGHGGPASSGKNPLGNTGWHGQTGAEDGIYEKDITLAVALRLAELARREGAKVYLTRDGDYAVVNKNRATAANAWARAQGATAGNYAFVSIHTNSRGTTNPDGTTVYDTSAQGTQVIWPKSQANNAGHAGTSAQLAAVVKAEFTRAMGTRDSGGWAQNLDVLYYSEYPAILLELMFQSNYAEEQRLLNYNEQWRMADAILAGLRRWWQRQF